MDGLEVVAGVGDLRVGVAGRAPRGVTGRDGWRVGVEGRGC